GVRYHRLSADVGGGAWPTRRGDAGGCVAATTTPATSAPARQAPAIRRTNGAAVFRPGMFQRLDDCAERRLRLTAAIPQQRLVYGGEVEPRGGVAQPRAPRAA